MSKLDDSLFKRLSKFFEFGEMKKVAFLRPFGGFSALKVGLGTKKIFFFGTQVGQHFKPKGISSSNVVKEIFKK